MKVYIAHPAMQAGVDLAKGSRSLYSGCDLVITTYALATRYLFLQAETWYYLILDEAQAIKNPGTKQTRSLKAYQARHRLVMTGTPIENRLSDLWSLFDFLNPGLLGTATEFKAFAKQAEGTSVADLVSRSGYGEKQIRNTIFRLNKSGKIRRVARGVYTAVK